MEFDKIKPMNGITSRNKYLRIEGIVSNKLKRLSECRKCLIIADSQKKMAGISISTQKTMI
jgi:hypothetical protein